jgi:hypothetical protein
MVGNRIGPYKFVREIGEDALGHIFQAKDISSKKPVTIRALRREAATSPETVARLYSEAKTLALLNHPHIARIFGFIRHNEQLFLVMEFVEGETLQSVLKAKRRLDPAVTLAYFHQILSAVTFAHKLGVIHGDLNPSNIIVTGFGQIKILDFAIAPILGDAAATGVRAGTARYLSPEQIRREPVDERSDIYSLGVLLYESLTGRAPFARGKESSAAAPAGESTPLPPSLLAKNSPAWLDGFVLRALAPAPVDRFQTVSMMSQLMDASVEAEINAAAERHRAQRRRRLGAAVFTPVRRAGESIEKGFSAAAASIRQKAAAAVAAADRGMARIQPGAWIHRGMAAIDTKLGAAAGMVQRALMALYERIAGIAANARVNTWRKSSALAAAVGGGLALLRARSAVKRRPAVSAQWMGALRAVPRAASKQRDWVRSKLGALAETGWQRYAAIAIVLASAMIEIFVFGGSNTLLMSDQNRLTVATQHGAAEGFLDPLPPQPVARAARAPDPVSPPPEDKPTKRTNPARKSLVKAEDVKEPAHEEARVAKRVVTYRSDLGDLRQRESKPSEPNPPRRNSESSVQLNVKWEN